MVEILILTHGGLAEELLTAAETIHGTASGVRALCLNWDDSLDEALAKTRDVCDSMTGPDGLLILTDMFGGTPHNVAKQLAEPGRVEVVTGANLPMVVRLCCREREVLPVAELAEWIIGKGRRSICRATPGCDCN
jgi:PTS system mannose-specific IIA component